MLQMCFFLFADYNRAQITVSDAVWWTSESMGDESRAVSLAGYAWPQR